ncbi:hypothetical protein P43SY_000543 [Pythium insidiosum]|uniref:Uncharacterized protein n=1 Tax=Pythium insidiosum TaxID=114742 RepID=A0AAD5Q979_PYTIN|nr:hypothetical protein P43SY_000543 [Pythium insidiosum]
MMRASRLATLTRARSPARALSTQRQNDELLVGGIAVRDLATLPRRELERRLGRSRLQQVAEALPHEIEQLLASRRLRPAALAELFDAAAACQSPPAMAAVLQALPPSRVDVARHNALFNALHRHQDRAGMRAFFEAAAQRLPRPLPDVVYRFGVVGALEPAAASLDGLPRLLEQMRSEGVAPSAETWSHLMLGLARRGDRAQALAAFEQLQRRRATAPLHEADVNRALLALGCLGETQQAFAFYEACALPLSATVFNALLSVCVHNGATQEAAAVLANRARFGLRLDRVGYARTLEALELLDRRDELGAVLAEMRREGVPLSAQASALVARNQEFLEGTPFALEPQSPATPEAVESLRQSQSLADPAERARLADRLVRPLREPVDGQRLSPQRLQLVRAGATRVEPLAGALPLVVQAYVDAAQPHKLHALVRGLEFALALPQEHAPRGHDDDLAAAIALLLRDAMAREDDELARAALRVAAAGSTLPLKLPPALVRSLLAFIAPRDDVPSAAALVRRLYAATDERAADDDVLVPALETLVRQDASVKQLARLLDDAASAVGPRVYASALTAMRQRRQRVLREQRKAAAAAAAAHDDKNADDSASQPPRRRPYDATDVAALWADCRRRVGRVDAALLNASSAWLAQSTDSAHRQLLVDAFDAVVADGERDGPALTAEVFSHMLAALEPPAAPERVLALVDAARDHLARQEQGVPAALVASAVELLAARDALSPATIERVLLSQRKPPAGALLHALHALTSASAPHEGHVRLAATLLQRLSAAQPRGVDAETAERLVRWLSAGEPQDEPQATATATAALARAAVAAFEQRKVATDAPVGADAKRWTKLVKHADGARAVAAWYRLAWRLQPRDGDAGESSWLAERVDALEALACTLDEPPHDEMLA